MALFSFTVSEEINWIDKDKNIADTIHVRVKKLFGIPVYYYKYVRENDVIDGVGKKIGFKK